MSCKRTYPRGPIDSRDGSVDARKWNHLLPFDPVQFGAFTLVEQDIELTKPLRSELRVLRDDADVAFIRVHDTLLNISRHRNRIDGRAADIGFGIL